MRAEEEDEEAEESEDRDEVDELVRWQWKRGRGETVRLWGFVGDDESVFVVVVVGGDSMVVKVELGRR